MSEQLAAAMAPRSKYHARKVKGFGHTFDSQMEYQRYLVLRDLERRHMIEQLTVHPAYEIHRPFRDRWGRAHKAANYVADFAYFDRIRKVHVVEDVKGVRTQVYRLKLRLFLDVYREHDFREVTKKDLGAAIVDAARTEGGKR